MNMKKKNINRFTPSDFQILLDDEEIAEIVELLELKEIEVKDIPSDVREAIKNYILI